MTSHMFLDFIQYLRKVFGVFSQNPLPLIVWRHLWTTLNDLLDKEDGESLKINGSNTKLLIVSALIGPDCVAPLGGLLNSNGLLRQFSLMWIHFQTFSLKHFELFLLFSTTKCIGDFKMFNVDLVVLF